MRLISPLLRHVVYPGLSRSGYLRRLASPAPAVLTYHGVVPSGDLPHPVLHDHLVTEDAFVSQLQLISSKYNPISPEQFLAWMEGKLELPSRSVLLTCDDGLLNTLTNMLPILHRFGLKCLFFVTADSTHRVSSMLWFEELYVWLLRARKEAAIDVRPLPPMRLAHEPSQLHSS